MAEIAQFDFEIALLRSLLHNLQDGNTGEWSMSEWGSPHAMVFSATDRDTVHMSVREARFE